MIVYSLNLPDNVKMQLQYRLEAMCRLELYYAPAGFVLL